MLPTEYQARKDFPLMTVLAAYFPDAIEALVGLCVQGNVQHKVNADAVNPFKLPDDAITWDRSKSMDQMNTLMRHAWDHERAKRCGDTVYDTDQVLHIVKVLWRAAAEAQLTIERLRMEAAMIKSAPFRHSDKIAGAVHHGAAVEANPPVYDPVTRSMK